MHRFRTLAAGILLACASLGLHGQTITVNRDGETISGPPATVDHASWLRAINQWRDAEKRRVNYSGALYDVPATKWTQRSFMEPQVMSQERYLYDPVARRYTVDRYLGDLGARYGGIDSVLIWTGYPNMGIDNRNQFDWMRDLPGGLPGIRSMIADFHRRGVHVLFPVNPWDTGTRLEGLPIEQTVARTFRDAGIDGIFGDTMGGGYNGYFPAAKALNYPMPLEPELGVDPQYNILNWAGWIGPPMPPLDRAKWIEPRHLSRIDERWSRNHIPALQLTFINGDGFTPWENVWGIWNGLTPRDAEAIRRTATIERALSDFLISPDHEPLFPTLQHGSVYAGRFSLGARTVWLLVNRTKKDANGPQLAVPYSAGMTYYDAWHGVKLTPQLLGGTATLSFSVEADGFGTVIALPGPPTPDVQKLLATMAALSAKPLADFPGEWTPLQQQLVDIPLTTFASSAPDGMVLITGGKYHFKVHGIEIESWPWQKPEDQGGVDVQMFGEKAPEKLHDLAFDMNAFYLDKYPVTNAQFKAFLGATKYHPADDHNFLKDWVNGTYPAGWAKKPVTWVSIEDARAYAAWAGKRLPHEWEWQDAAQGSDGRLYPWGKSPDPTAIPAPDYAHDLRGPADVDAYPKGASPFGVMDMTGNVWQWTDEYRDEHTRAAVLRGGSYYRPAGSQWYFPPNTMLDQHGKYLLLSPGSDRSGTIGFRCVKDISNAPPQLNF